MVRALAELWRRLGQAAVLAGLDEPALKQLAVRTRVHHPARGSLLWARGDAADTLGVVLGGRLDICRVSAQGQRVLLRTLGPGEVVGLSTVAGASHSADVTAGPELQLALVPGAALRALVQQHPELGLRMVAHMADLLGRLTDEHEARQLHGVATRLLAFLQRQARGRREIRLTHEELAQHLGASRAKVSHALKRLEREGVLRCGRGRIEFLDAATRDGAATRADVARPDSDPYT